MAYERLDAVNRTLLRYLHEDPRMSMSALARRIGMSAPAVTERVQRMRDSGVITGFRMDVDPAALGMGVTAFARIRPSAGQLSRVAELATELPQVTECYRITGEESFLVKVHAPSLLELEQSLDPFLMHGQTITSIVVSTPVPPRALPLDDTRPVRRRPARRAGSARSSRAKGRT